MARHSVLTGDDLHEPKGAATATLGQIYIADGAGSGEWKEPGGSVYGEMSITGNSSTIAPTASGDLDLDTDYVKVDSGIWATGPVNGMTFNSSGYMLIATAGLYEVSFWASFSISAVGTNLFAFKFSIDDTTGTLSPRRLTRQSNNSNDVGSVAASAFITALAVDSKVSMWAACEAASTTALILDAGMTLTLLKED